LSGTFGVVRALRSPFEMSPGRSKIHQRSRARGVRPPSAIVVASRHVLLRKGVAGVCEREKDLCLAAEAHDVPTLLSSIATHRTDVALVDIDSLGVDGLQQVATNRDGTIVLAITSSRDPGIRRVALASGAAGVTHTDEPVEVFLEAVRAALGRGFLGARLPSRQSRGPTPPVETGRVTDTSQIRVSSLTKQERTILGLVVSGLKNGSIAKRLGVSERTVRNHMTAVLQKLNLSSRVELVLYAFRHNLASQLDT
jgi:DNA-binding NarL/FixJ family response regulator